MIQILPDRHRSLFLAISQRIQKSLHLRQNLHQIEAMSQAFNQTVTFKLDKAHFQECFEQSALRVQKKDYAKAAIFGVVSIGLFFVEAEHYYLPFFIFCLAILEVFSVQYRQTWWVWRQLMSKAANGPVKLIFDEKGITTESEQVNTQLDWNDVNDIEQTEKGLLLRHQGGVNYLSNSYLGKEVVEFILRQNKG